MDLDVLINDLIEVKEMLETVQSQYNISGLDPLWTDSMDKLTAILEELEE
ncbi:MAG: hypothetical protein ACYS32_00535 [Planctomycetota bacterium]